MSNMPVPAAAEGLPEFTRRKALGLMTAVAIQPAAAVDAAPSLSGIDDGELLALGAEFEQIHARFLVAQSSANELIATCEANLKAAGIAVASDTWWSTRSAECDAAIHEWNDLGEATEVAANKIRTAKASTVSGLLVKAKTLPFDLCLQADHSEPRNDWNWDVECLQVFIEEMERFAGRQA